MKLNNKKAQNVTEPFTIIFILVMVTLVSILMFNFGADYAEDPTNKLNNESVAYIFNKAGFEGTSNITSENSQDTFFTSNVDSEGNLKDFALEFQFYREQSSSIRVILQDVWNVPSFFVNGFDLDAKLWGTAIAIWNTILWTVILYAIFRFLRARIK